MSLDMANRCNYFSTIWGLLGVKAVTDLLFIEPSSEGVLDPQTLVWIATIVISGIMAITDDFLTVFMVW